MHWAWCHPERHDDVTAWTLDRILKVFNIPIEFYFMGLMTSRARFFTVSLDDKERCPKVRQHEFRDEACAWRARDSSLSPSLPNFRRCEAEDSNHDPPKIWNYFLFDQFYSQRWKRELGPSRFLTPFVFPSKQTEPAHCFFHLAYFIGVAFHFPSLMWHSCKYSYSFFL